MSDNKRPPGYVPLTIHELAAGQKGKRGTAFDYVFSLDARAVDDSVLSSNAARAAVGAPRNGGRPAGERQENGFGRGGDRDQNRGGRRGNRRGRNNNNNRRGYNNGGQDGDGNWNEAGGAPGQEEGFRAEAVEAAPAAAFEEDI
jgi:hypothetical protein